jgi:hypothetical protein
METEMRTMAAAVLAGSVALAAASVQAATLVC